jgi:glycosyltransferase involved in cell wall biosynthesis
MKSADQNAKRRSWAINGRFLTQRMTGVQRYAYEIVAALDALLGQNDEAAAALAMRLVVPPGVEKTPSLANIAIYRTRRGSGHAWDQLILPLHAGRGVLSLGNFGPVLTRRHIVCIHDANTFILPESYSQSFGLAYRTLLPWVGRRARRVATVSQFSADMLVKYGVCRRDKIFIAPNGHEHVLRWDAKRARLPLIGSLKRPYVLLLGSRAKHKNIDVVLEQAQALDHAGIDIVVTGGASTIFTAPDIPPLEAMAKGCPVISSNAASLVEVGGDAVLYADPDDGAQWRDAIIGLSANGDLRATLAAKGRQRAALFSWKRSAGLYLDEILRQP